MAATSARLYYRAWEGNNKFYCGGRLMMGSDTNQFACTLLLSTAPTALFVWETAFRTVTYDSPFGPHRWFVAAAALVLYTMAMVFLIVAAVLDPAHALRALSRRCCSPVTPKGQEHRVPKEHPRQ